MGKLTQIYTWAAASTTAVCQLQTLAAAGSLIINGSLVTGTAPFIASFGTVSRTVSLTSANNLSAVNVTVAGTYQGAVVTSTIVGPSNSTVYTTQLYDTVTAVSTSAAVTALSVGSGTSGNTHWDQYDYYRPYPSMSVQVVVTGTVSYAFQTTLDDVTVVTTPFVNTGIIVPIGGAATNAFTWQTLMGAATATSQFAYFSYPVQYSNVLVNSATTGSLIVKLIQQGIR
jgi:hypothetical protein